MLGMSVIDGHVQNVSACAGHCWCVDAFLQYRWCFWKHLLLGSRMKLRIYQISQLGKVMSI